MELTVIDNTWRCLNAMPSHSLSSSEADSSDDSDRPRGRAKSNQNNGEFSLKNNIHLDIDLQPLTVNEPLVTVEDLEDDDNEIWIVTCPTSVSC